MHRKVAQLRLVLLLLSFNILFIPGVYSAERRCVHVEAPNSDGYVETRVILDADISEKRCKDFPVQANRIYRDLLVEAYHDIVLQRPVWREERGCVFQMSSISTFEKAWVLIKDTFPECWHIALPEECVWTQYFPFLPR